MAKASVGCILRSPAAQAELARLANLAVDKSTDIPGRVALHHQLAGAAVEAVHINRTLMKDPFVKAETRSRIGQHFMDRVLFNKRDSEDESQESYRSILRRLDKIHAQIALNGNGDGTKIVESEEIPKDKVVDVSDNDRDGDINGQDLALTRPLDYFLDSKHIIDLGEVDD